MGTLEPLSNLTSLTELCLYNCGHDLTCKGLGPLITNGLTNLKVLGSPRFFAGWDPNPRRVQLQPFPPPSSSKLQELWTSEVMGLLAAPICSFLSSSLTHLTLFGKNCKMKRFTKKQEDSLHLLSSIQELNFWNFKSLPTGLHKLTSLKRLEVCSCSSIRSLPKDGLPKSLQVLDVSGCLNKELKQQCRGLVGTIPKIII
ncbi:hypothetical protein ACQJBY_014549 [Aegilops geniculata]